MIDLYGVLQEQETVNGELGLGVDYYKGEKGEQGIPGKDGKDGSDQVYVGADEPTDERVKLWIDTDATPPSKTVSWDEIENKPEIPAPYTLPTASTSTLGGVKVDGNTITIADGVISSVGSAEPDAYIKDASVSGNTLTLTKKDDTEVVFTPTGGSSGGGDGYRLPVATPYNLGGIKVGDGSFATNGCVTLELDKDNLAYIPHATSTAAGSVLPIITNGLKYDYNTGTLSLNVATSKVAGVVKPDGKTITVDTNGVIKAINTYTLPTASTSTLGGVKVDNDTIMINNGVISINKSQISASNGLPIGGYYSQILVKNSSDNFDATWLDVSNALSQVGITVGGSDWQYTQDNYDSNLYNAKELVVYVENTSGNKQMGYFNFGANGSNLGNNTGTNFYFNYDSYSPYIIYDGSGLSYGNVNNLFYIYYKT